MNEEIDHIVHQSKLGKRKFQSKLYYLFADQLHNAALRYEHDPNKIQDHIHNAFVKILSKINTYNGQGYQIYQWMLRILINEILQQKRRDQKIIYVDQYEDEELEDGMGKILSKLSIDEIWNLIRSMNEEDQRILNLNLVDELSHKEISELLGISIQNSRIRLHRAKSNIKKIILNQRAAKNEEYK